MTTKYCSVCKELKYLTDYPRNVSKSDGVESCCKVCHNKRNAEYKAEKKREAEELRFASYQAAQSKRLASDHESLRAEDFDVGVGNVPRNSAEARKAAAEKRQEFNAEMAHHATVLKQAANTAPQNGGDILSSMDERSGGYIGKLLEQEKRFQNRRLARTISLSQAAEALNLQHMKLVAEQFFSSKIQATGFATKKPNKAAKRSVCLLLSDWHIGAELSSLDEPMPFRALQEARRIEYLLRETIDYKPQYRSTTKLVLLINGDMMEGQLLHQLGAGAPLAEQKAAVWMYLRALIAELSAAFQEVEVHFQPGNHGRDKVRHPGRATWRKWDGHEFEVGFALEQMCKGLLNVTWHQPFKAVSIVNLHGSNLGLTHGDTEVKMGHPDKASEQNARQLDRINATRIWGVEFAAWAFGHFHTGRYHAGGIPTIWNGALVPPNGHARSEGYIGDPCCQFLWESVEGFPIGDVRVLRLDSSVDNDDKLGQIIKPFRFPTE